MPRHVFILGNSGSGKSTLAKSLAAERGLLHVDLDRFAFADLQGTRRPLADSVAAIAEHLSGRAAIIEGCYADLVQVLASDRDHLVWLDVPVERCIAHAAARPWEPHKWPSQAQQDEFLPRLVEWIRGYPTDPAPTGRRAHEALWQAFPGTRERRD